MAVKVRERPEGSGVWWVYIDHHGHRKAKKIGKNEKAAREVAKKIEAKLALDDFDLLPEERKQAPAFKEYAEMWLETFIKPFRRISTYERYKVALKKHVYPTLGKIAIDQLRRRQIRDLLLKLHKKGLSRSTVCLVRDIISGPLGVCHG